MSAPKDCCRNRRRTRLYRLLFALFLTFIIAILFVILVIWLVLRPTKPRFSIQDATIYQFNVTAPNILSTTLQVTLYCRNPNDRIGIYYSKLYVYASYRNQQITLPTVILPNYQGHNDITVWSPFLYGSSVPVSTYLTSALSGDENAGFIPVSIKLDGRVRWKVGTWISGHYHISVNCPAYMIYSPGSAIRLQQPSGCSVDV
ncbi:NDR1/HIN1-like protein 12 [Magnolia sinica]|uniref:NDR1/HIN1-like protein 12 n=1 Tax=Magnolia sinica TaxID=86752 RepID=UPI002658872D|nr:NDR1/HIN1-like protein 12 [Magnolia sinica]